MTTRVNEENTDELREEYDFQSLDGGVRGKHFKRAGTATNLVLLDPDVAKAFPTPEAVNKALRMLAKVAEEASK
ncbi:MAG: hypothetical protein PVG92_09040 [Holophagae bacterium]|jgi:hypothetical protein